MHWYHWLGIGANVIALTAIILELKALLKKEKTND